ncbi:hypothetical protein V2O64_19360 [Verrucomicrobiaceae bacterium 227]
MWKFATIIVVSILGLIAFLSSLRDGVKADGSFSSRSESELELQTPRGINRTGTEGADSKTRIVVSGTGSAEFETLNKSSNFSREWDEIDNENINNNKKYVKMLFLVSRMGRLGLVEDAVALIREKTGVGAVQQALIVRSFVSAEKLTPAEYMGLVERCALEDGKNLKAAMRGIGERLALEELNLPEIVEYGKLGGREDSSLLLAYFGGRLVAYHREARGASEVFDELTAALPTLLEKDLIRGNEAGKLVLEAPISPFERATTLSNLKIPIGDLDGTQELAKAMIRESPAATMEFLENSNSQEMVSAAVDLWLGLDPSKVGEWISSNKSKISSDFYDLIIPSLVDVSIRGNDLEAGKEWIEEVTNRELKEALRTKISNRENQEPLEQ